MSEVERERRDRQAPVERAVGLESRERAHSRGAQLARDQGAAKFAHRWVRSQEYRMQVRETQRKLESEMAQLRVYTEAVKFDFIKVLAACAASLLTLFFGYMRYKNSTG
jgi:hypothetical protein